MAHTEHTSPKYNLSGSLLYSLHIRPGGRNVECNQFSIAIQPDYGGGITQEDAENEAARIHSILTEYDQLKAELEATKERENKLEGLVKLCHFMLSSYHETSMGGKLAKDCAKELNL